MRTRNPTGLMWAQACDVLEQAEQMRRHFFRLAASQASQAVWEPPVDIFEDEREVLVVVALPGVPFERVEVILESLALVVRAERRMPFAGPGLAVRRMEIPYGRFERRIALPPGRVEAGTREFSDGCLIVRLRKTENL